MYLLGLDAGTTGCKAVVFDTQGNIIESAYREYPLIYPAKGWMELDPELVLSSLYSCIKQCTGKCDSSKIRSLAVSSQGEAIIPVGMDGCSLSNSIITFDSRNAREFEWFRDRFDKTEVMRITGAPIHTMFSITKILWIRNNLPHVYENTWKFMCFGDYIAYKLGAEPVMDYSMASRTMAFDIVRKEWSEHILNMCGIKKSMLPDICPSGKIIGNISLEASRILNLPSDTVIVSGGHDQVCCSLGSGVLGNGMAMDSLGTTESIVCVNSEPVITSDMITINLPCYVYPVNNLYAYLTFLSSSGSVLKWYRDNFLNNSRLDVYSDMDRIVKEKYKYPTNLYVLPHFSGSGTPYLDFKSTGLIAGLTLDSDRYMIYRAILEGTCMEARINIESMEKCGVKLDELRCIGGGSKSDLWLQMKADITGKRVISMRVNEAGCLGAAILAGIGCGVFHDADNAVNMTVKIGNEYMPEPGMYEEYDRIFKKFGNLYRLSKYLHENT